MDASLLSQDGAWIALSRFIFESASFPSCHAASIVQTETGRVLAAWFGGSEESHPDVGVYLSELDGNGWTSLRQVAVGFDSNGERLPCYNPVLFQPSGGPILLFYKVGTGPQSWWGMLTRSEDDGKTWAAPLRLPQGILGPIKNKPLELPDHTLVCPSSTEDRGWRVHFETTRDFGETWTKSAPVNGGRAIGAIQPSLLTLPGGHLRAVGRTRQGFMFSIDSHDQGRSWGKMSLTNVANPNSGCDAITLADGRHLLVYNDSSTERTPLRVAISDDAHNWRPILALETGQGEYSYPSLIQSRDGAVHIVYTWRRTHIKHAVLELANRAHAPEAN